MLFRGKGFDELYVTSSAHQLSDEESKETPLAGSVFRVTGIGVRGTPASVYEGWQKERICYTRKRKLHFKQGALSKQIYKRNVKILQIYQTVIFRGTLPDYFIYQSYRVLAAEFRNINGVCRPWLKCLFVRPKIEM